jgi:rubrerythrin
MPPRLNAQPMETDDDLRAALQNAIALEHATIPPYLTALLTLSGTSESVEYAKSEITEVIKEEMLHMTLACNILNAVGGQPKIADASFVPTYPGTLPMGVAGDLEVGLRRFSKALVEHTFMEIEKPLKVLPIPDRRHAAAAAEPITIGQFYAGIAARIDGHPELFTGHADLQVSGVLGAFPVTDVKDALTAIETIVEQGEGTSKLPLDLQKDVAHFYSFQQFSKGMRIVHDDSSEFTVSFDPDQPITIDDTADVIAMIDDPPLVTYDAADAHAEELSTKADVLYSDMLRALQRAFNGDSNALGDAVGAMSDLEEAITTLLKVQLTAGPFAGQFAGPRFRYVA